MNKFRALRLRARLSAAEAAQRIGVTKGNILHWESGRASPRLARLPKIAAVYQCDIIDLVGDIDRKESPS